MSERARALAAVFVRDARLAFTTPLSLITRLSSALVGVAGFYFVAQLVDPHRLLHTDGHQAGYFAYVSINLTFMLLQTSALLSFSQTIRFDQLVGSLEPILATPIEPGLFVLATGLWPMLLAVVQVGLTLAVSAAFFGLDLHATNFASLITFAALGTLTMAGLGLLSAAAVIAFKQIPPSGYLVGGLGSLLAGTLFPVHLLPRPLQFVSWCLPLTHALAGVRGAVGGATLAQLSGDAAWLLTATLVLAPASLVVLDRVIRRGRFDGTLAHY